MIYILYIIICGLVLGFRNINSGTFTHLNKNINFKYGNLNCPYRSTKLFSKRFEIYRLRRQKEIYDSFESIFTRQRGLRIGNNISPELIHGISVMEVKLNSDCTHADIYILVSGDSFQQRQCYSWLNRNSKRLRYLMGQMLKYRKNVPTINFHPYNFDIHDDEDDEDIEIEEKTYDENFGGNYEENLDEENIENDEEDQEKTLKLIEII
ncbi:Ribosome-binding factor A family protein [Theileria parva strain Muguga]|uniref:Ribosome-binding factor A family protein n=1 Tax=Theileria parva strain Muguga TaxID=333668 RepID=UPI001C6183B0|nr:Ribosome-binding factor A family protein [Theileria parva strain Muguga]KAF5153200.1 Ribosome-binding factor A family protein [Theileria parva strain Muguga]